METTEQTPEYKIVHAPDGWGNAIVLYRNESVLLNDRIAPDEEAMIFVKDRLAERERLTAENARLKEELIRRIDYDSSMEKCANLINENTELRKENQRAMKLVGDTEYANSTLESQVADLREALDSARSLCLNYSDDRRDKVLDEIDAALAKTEPEE